MPRQIVKVLSIIIILILIFIILINYQDGETALLWAANRGHPGVVKMLLEWRTFNNVRRMREKLYGEVRERRKLSSPVAT